MDAFRRHGAYIVPEEDRDKVVNALFEDGHISARIHVPSDAEIWEL